MGFPASFKISMFFMKLTFNFIFTMIGVFELGLSDCVEVHKTTGLIQGIFHIIVIFTIGINMH